MSSAPPGMSTRVLAALGVMTISFAALLTNISEVSAATASFFRCLYALPVLVVIMLVVRRRRSDSRSWRARGLAVLSGAFFAADLTAWHTSIELIGTGLATLLANTQVVFVAFLAWIVLRERPSRAAFMLVPAVMVGVTLISGVGQEGTFGDDPLRGVAYGLFCGVAYALFLLTFRSSNRVQAHPVFPLLDATIGTVVTSFVFGLFESGFSLDVHFPSHAWLLVLAVGPQVVGWLLIATALPRLPALETSVILLLQPVGAITWGVLLLGEQLAWVQFAGAAVVLVGLGVLSIVGSVEDTSVVSSASAAD